MNSAWPLLSPPLGGCKIGQRAVGLDAVEGGVEGGARDAERFGLRPQRLEPGAELRVGGVGGGGEGEAAQGEEEECGGEAQASSVALFQKRHALRLR